MVNFSLFVQCLVKYALTYWDLHVCGHVCARQNLLTDKFPSISHTLIASWLMKYAAYCSCSRANLQSLRLLRVCFCVCTLAGYTWRMFSLFGFDTDSLLFDFWSIQHTFKAAEQICNNYTVSCACICVLMQDIDGDKFCWLLKHTAYSLCNKENFVAVSLGSLAFLHKSSGSLTFLSKPTQWAVLWGGCKGVINFRWIFSAVCSLVPVGHFRNISRHLIPWLVCGSFQWRHGLLFTNCIRWDDKGKVIGFKRSHGIQLGWWSTGSPKLQLFQLSQHSQVINCRLISSSP